MIEEHLALPFETRILGVPVAVAKVDISDREIIAICKRGCLTQRIAILDIPLPTPAPGCRRMDCGLSPWRLWSDVALLG
jgi:hypothetical protein